MEPASPHRPNEATDADLSSLKPTELAHVLSFCSVVELGRMGRTNKGLGAAAREPELFTNRTAELDPHGVILPAQMTAMVTFL